ncbi:hypothetical protein [Cupriavidus taiwanensis]|uniref:hypothetical protein n=1 Tax=Cupriavidus taiwanensis TaxID=164546 RepID=UPI0011C07AE2|nr:hypothetical protein [Cupriavidus taiwanensis]
MKMLAATVLLGAAGCAMGAESLIDKNRAWAAEQAVKPQWKVQQEAEDARIRMKSFDPATVGRVAFIFSNAIEENISRGSMVTVLYRDTPCRLPIVNAKDMRAAETLHGRALVPACWGTLVGPTKDRVVVVSTYGDARQDSLTAYVEAKIQRDGSAQYVKPAMSQEEFMKNVRSYHDSLR